MSGWTDTWNKEKGVAPPVAKPITPESYFAGDDRLVFTQYGPMSQRYALKSMYNGVTPQSGFQYVPYEQYGEVLNKYDPSALGFNWTGKAKSAQDYVGKYFSSSGQKYTPAGDAALAAGVNYGSGANTANIFHTMPTTPVDWNAIANQTSYDPAGTGVATNPVTGKSYLEAAANPVSAPTPAGFQLPEGFDVAKGATGEGSPEINKTVYGEDYFPGAREQGFNVWMKGQGWEGAVPSNAQEFARMTPEQQGQYRTLLQRKHAMDVADLGKGSMDPAVNKQLYGEDYFPANTEEAFGSFMQQQGWQGAVPKTKEEFAQLTPEQQEQYRKSLHAYNQNKAATQALGGGGAAPPDEPPPGPGDPGLPPPEDPGISYPPGADPNDPNRPGGGGAGNGSNVFDSLGGNLEEQPWANTPQFLYKMQQAEKALGRKLRALGRENSSFGMNEAARLYKDMYAEEEDKWYQRAKDLSDTGFNAATMENANDSQAMNVLTNLYQRYGEGNAQDNAAFSQWLTNNIGSFVDQSGNLDLANANAIAALYQWYATSGSAAETGAANPLAQLTMQGGNVNASTAAILGKIPGDILQMLIQSKKIKAA